MVEKGPPDMIKFYFWKMYKYKQNYHGRLTCSATVFSPNSVARVSEPSPGGVVMILVTMMIILVTIVILVMMMGTHHSCILL